MCISMKLSHFLSFTHKKHKRKAQIVSSAESRNKNVELLGCICKLKKLAEMQLELMTLELICLWRSLVFVLDS